MVDSLRGKSVKAMPRSALEETARRHAVSATLCRKRRVSIRRFYGQDRTTTRSQKTQRSNPKRKCDRLQANFVTTRMGEREGRRIVVGIRRRDGAGRGNHQAITERVSPRVFACGSARSMDPSEVAAIHPALYGAFSSGGGDHHFDRSCTCAGVEYVMGFCSKAETATSSNFARRSKKSSSTRASSSSSIGWKLAITNKSAVLKRVSRIRCANGN